MATFSGNAPWLLEDRLRLAGAQYHAGPAYEPHTITDGNLVTRQQNYSAHDRRRSHGRAQNETESVTGKIATDRDARMAGATAALLCILGAGAAGGVPARLIFGLAALACAWAHKYRRRAPFSKCRHTRRAGQGLT